MSCRIDYLLLLFLCFFFSFFFLFLLSLSESELLDRLLRSRDLDLSDSELLLRSLRCFFFFSFFRSFFSFNFFSSSYLRKAWRGVSLSESELVLETSKATSRSGSSFTKFLHSKVKCPEYPHFLHPSFGAWFAPPGPCFDVPNISRSENKSICISS